MNRVIVRPPTRGEVERTAYVAMVAFNTPIMDQWLRSYTWIADNPGLDFLAVVEADGEIVASLVCTPGNARFMDDIVPISAVGGVATLPEHRKFGYAGLLMEYTVKLLRDKGIHTSALWPFSYHYYRKFGWEIAAEHRKYVLPTEFAAGLGSSDGVRLAKETDIPAISALVARFASRHNCLTVRDDNWWNCINTIYGTRFDSDELGAAVRPLVHETGGRIDGYAFFLIDGEGESRSVNIRELIAETGEARRAILSKLATIGAASMWYTAPIDDDFVQEIPNPRLFTKEIESGFQFRVINPPAALECRTLDSSIKGRVGFTIHDPVLPVWEFDIEVEEGHIRTANSRAVQRLTMDVQTFAQLFSGYISTTRAAQLGRVQPTSDEALKFADQVLHRGVPFRSYLEQG